MDSEFGLEWIGLDWLGWIHKLIRYSTRTKFISGFEWAGFEQAQNKDSEF